VAFFETVTMPGTRVYVLAVTGHHARRIRVLGATPHPATFYRHRPRQGIANARPLRPLPPPITDPDQIARLDIRRRQRLGGILNEYDHAA
jgi:hypothetical protein